MGRPSLEGRSKRPLDCIRVGQADAQEQDEVHEIVDVRVGALTPRQWVGMDLLSFLANVQRFPSYTTHTGWHAGCAARSDGGAPA